MRNTDIFGLKTIHSECMYVFCLTFHWTYLKNDGRGRVKAEKNGVREAVLAPSLRHTGTNKASHFIMNGPLICFSWQGHCEWWGKVFITLPKLTEKEEKDEGMKEWTNKQKVKAQIHALVLTICVALCRCPWPGQLRCLKHRLYAARPLRWSCILSQV